MCGAEDPNYVPPHEHSWSNATCTEPQKCECGETQGTALGHSFVQGTCTVCGADDPNYVPPHEHKFGDWICEATVVGKHYRECECGERENGDCQWDDGEITLEPDYDAYGEKTYICTLCGGSKKERIDMLVKVDEIISSDENVKVSVPEGSDAVIDENTTLEVDKVDDEIPEDVENNVSAAIGEDKQAEVLATYDIELTLDGVNIQPGGEIEVTLPIPETTAVYDSFGVVYIDDQGNATTCETTVNGDGTLTFLTNHFSRYAIVGIINLSVDGGDEPEIPLYVWIIALVVGILIIIGCLIGFPHGKKTSSENEENPDGINDGETTEPEENPEKINDEETTEPEENPDGINDGETTEPEENNENLE